MNRTTVGVPDKSYQKLLAMRDRLREETDRRVTIAEVLEIVIKAYEKENS